MYINLFIFIYFWLRWVFIAVCGLSLVVAHGLLTAVASRRGARVLGAQASVVVSHGLSICGLRAQ